MSGQEPRTRLGGASSDDVFVRGKSLSHDLIGKVSFTEMIFFEITGALPTPGQRAVLDACLVALAEHGLSPSAIATRLVYSSAPEALQAAVAAGLLGVGSVFVGSVEGSAALLVRIVASKDVDAEAEAIVSEHRARSARIPGFGHPVHKPEDPRTAPILDVARQHGVLGEHVAALLALSAAVDRAASRHVLINATGAVAAALADCGVPPAILRGLVLISRCAGLVAHVHEEQVDPAMRVLWAAGERAVSYSPPRPP